SLPRPVSSASYEFECLFRPKEIPINLPNLLPSHAAMRLSQLEWASNLHATIAASIVLPRAEIVVDHCGLPHHQTLPRDLRRHGDRTLFSNVERLRDSRPAENPSLCGR